MKKTVVEKIKKNLLAKGWLIEKIKKMDFWASHGDAPAFCVVQAGCALIFFCDLPLNDKWKRDKARFFAMLNSINHSLSHGVRVIKLIDDPANVLHVSAVWYNYYDKKEFDQFFGQFLSSVVALYTHDGVLKNLKK